MHDMPSVLIVEDDQKLGEILASILRRVGLSVWAASNGAEAMERVRKYRPAVVLLDLKLPVMSGWDVLRKLNASGDLDHLSVIVFSSDDDPKIERAAREAGAADFIPKGSLSSKMIALRVKQMIRAAGATRVPG